MCEIQWQTVFRLHREVECGPAGLERRVERGTCGLVRRLREELGAAEAKLRLTITAGYEDRRVVGLDADCLLLHRLLPKRRRVHVFLSEQLKVLQKRGKESWCINDC